MSLSPTTRFLKNLSQNSKGLLMPAQVAEPWAAHPRKAAVREAVQAAVSSQAGCTEATARSAQSPIRVRND